MITSNIDLAVEQLHQGGIIGMPTETVYGLAADANCESAIKKIYAIKKRPSSHPLIMHVAHDWDLHTWAENIPPYVLPLIEQFWPGPLTLVLNLKSNSGCLDATWQPIGGAIRQFIWKDKPYNG